MADAKQPGSGAPGLRVLVVEDEIMIALLLEELLADLGHSVLGPFSRVDKAVEAARRETADIAILDVNINGSEIYPVADALAARSIPFVFCTGYGKQALHPPYTDRPTLRKPFRRHELQELLVAVSRAKPA